MHKIILGNEINYPWLSYMRYNYFTIPLFLLFLASCSISPYKVTLYQGNAFNETNINQLKLQMTPAEVIAILGSPQITDSFSPDRWDYAYIYKKDGDSYMIRHLYLIFIDNKLITISPVTDQLLKIAEFK